MACRVTILVKAILVVTLTMKIFTSTANTVTIVVDGLLKRE